MKQAQSNKKTTHGQPPKQQQDGLLTRKIAAKILEAIFDDKKSLDVLIDTQHGMHAYNALDIKDRALVRAIIMICLRRKGQIDAALASILDRKTPKKARHLTHTLSVAAAQILFLDIPDSAAVNLAVTAVSNDSRTKRFGSLTNAVLRRLSREKEKILEKQNAAQLFMPGWFYKRIKKSYGRDRVNSIAENMLEEPALDITVKSDPEFWAEKLSGIVLPTGTVRLKPKGPIPAMEGFSAGQWWVQDAAACLPAQLLGDIAGLQVADLCAAPGGKTAQLVQKGAAVTALDISPRRMQRLKDNLTRLNLSANFIVADILQWQPESLFDAVLLDAPCSSTGTVRRHPDVMWTKSASDITALATLQFELWDAAINFVKPDGIIVFSNCSLDREEGEDLYAKMLAHRQDITPMPFKPEEVPGLKEAITGQGTLRTLPSHLANSDKQLAGMDGFFAARFRRI